jgi:hypothetical protein
MNKYIGKKWKVLIKWLWQQLNIQTNSQRIKYCVIFNYHIEFRTWPSHDFPEPLLHDVALEQQSKIEILYTVKHNIFTKTLINTQNVTKFIKQYFYNERKITYRSVNNHSTSSNDIIRHFVYCQWIFDKNYFM